MERKTKPLQRVVLEYPITIIDTSALFYPTDGCPKREDKSNEARILRSQMIFDSAIFYRKFLESGGRFYVTPKVLEEYDSSDYISRKQKELSERGRLPHDEFELFKARQRDNQEKEKLIKMLESSGGVYILSVEEKDEYDFLNSKYSHLRYKGVVGDVDFDLLISVAAVSKKGKRPACLISGDRGICDYWREIGIGERIAPERFGFFERKREDVFQRENFTFNKKRRR